MSSYRPRTLTEYLQALWRRKLLFFLVAGVLLISTFFIIARLPDVYQASASVVVAGKQEDRQVIASRVATITEKINSRAFLEPLLGRHGLYQKNSQPGAIESAVNRMRRDIKISAKYRGDNPEMLTIAFRHTNPETARNVATDLVSTFEKMNQAVETETAQQSNSVSSEIAAIEERLSQLSEQRAISASRSRTSGYAQSAINTIRAQRTAAQSSVEALTDKEYALQQQIAEQKRQMAEQEQLIKSNPRDVRSGSSYGVLLVRKAELEAQLKDYLSQYTDKNPKVIQTQNQIAELDRQMAQLTATAGQGAALDPGEARELRSLQRDLTRMQTELAITQRELERRRRTLASTPNVGPVGAPPGEAPIQNIAIETDERRLQDRYASLLRQEEALSRERAAAAGLQPGVFQIIDMPALPQLPSGPDRFKLQALALAGSLLIALIVVAVAEFPRLYAIRDDRDVNYYLGAPVIALIPESLTPTERGRARRLMLTQWLGIVLLAAALIPCLIFLLNQLRVIQVFASRW